MYLPRLAPEHNTRPLLTNRCEACGVKVASFNALISELDGTLVCRSCYGKRNAA